MRRLLIDTHVFLWWLADDPQLGPKARELIANAGIRSLSVQLRHGKSRSRNQLANSTHRTTWMRSQKKRASRNCRSVSFTENTLANCRNITAIPSTGCWSRSPKLKGWKLSPPTALLRITQSRP